jgi:hypothetical protein
MEVNGHQNAPAALMQRGRETEAIRDRGLVSDTRFGPKPNGRDTAKWETPWCQSWGCLSNDSGISVSSGSGITLRIVPKLWETSGACKICTDFKVVHTLHLLDSICVFTNKMHYMSKNSHKVATLTCLSIPVPSSGVYWAISPEAKKGHQPQHRDSVQFGPRPCWGLNIKPQTGRSTTTYSQFNTTCMFYARL